MSYINKIRRFINKDDGKYYKIGNKNLNCVEIIGYFILIVGFLAYVLHDKAGVGHFSIYISLLIAGTIIIGVGNTQGDKN